MIRERDSTDKEVEDNLESCIANNQLILKNGKTSSGLTAYINEKTPVVDRMVGETAVKTLRDNGCSGIVVQRI